MPLQQFDYIFKLFVNGDTKLRNFIARSKQIRLDNRKKIYLLQILISDHLAVTIEKVINFGMRLSKAKYLKDDLSRESKIPERKLEVFAIFVV